LQLKRRLDSIRRIHIASDELEDRIDELEAARAALDEQIRGLQRQIADVDQVIEATDPLPLAANA